MTSRDRWHSVVCAKQAAETAAPHNLPTDRGDRIASRGRRSELPTPMLTLSVVMQTVLTQDRFKVSLVHDQHPVETLPPTTPDPAFGVRVRLRRPERGQDHPSPVRPVTTCLRHRRHKGSRTSST